MTRERDKVVSHSSNWKENLIGNEGWKPAKHLQLQKASCFQIEGSDLGGGHPPCLMLTPGRQIQA